MKIKIKRIYYIALLLAVSSVLIGCRKKSEISIMPSELAGIATQPNTEVVEITEIEEIRNECIIATDGEGNLWLSGDGNDDTNPTEMTEMKQGTDNDTSNTAQVPVGNTETTTANKQESTMPPQTEVPDLLPEETKRGSSDENATPWG